MAFFSRVLISTAYKLDTRWGWDRLPKPLGILALAGLRKLYRQKNLYDTTHDGFDPRPRRETEPARYPGAYDRRQL
jgi:hypothetical protein